MDAKSVTVSLLAMIALLCLLVGIAAGFLAGLFGIGGGMIMVAALAFVLPMLAVPEAHVMHMALATSLACIVLTAIASTRAHHRRGSVQWTSVAWLVPGLIGGGMLGALFAAPCQTPGCGSASPSTVSSPQQPCLRHASRQRKVPARARRTSCSASSHCRSASCRHWSASVAVRCWCRS